MKQIVLQAEPREKTGKEVSKKLRKKGLIPAILYGKGIEPIPLNIKYSEFEKIYNKYKGETVIFTLEFPNNKEFKKQAILKDIQKDPVTDLFIHLDFQSVEEGRPIEVEVPLEFVGKPIGITKGGILEIMLHELTIECLPTEIPDKIVVDISGLDIGDSLHVKDLQVPQGLKVKDHPEETVATVVAEEEATEEVAPTEEKV
ncbi:MAG: 50S ribosomal protein L25/general stress protein Ctc [Caldimicrobium sp.]